MSCPPYSEPSTVDGMYRRNLEDDHVDREDVEMDQVAQQLNEGYSIQDMVSKVEELWKKNQELEAMMQDARKRAKEAEDKLAEVFKVDRRPNHDQGARMQIPTTSQQGKQRDYGHDADDEGEGDPDQQKELLGNLASRFPKSTIGGGPALRLKPRKAIVGPSFASPNAGAPSNPNIFQPSQNIHAVSPESPNLHASQPPDTQVESLERAILQLTGCVTNLANQMSAAKPSRTAKYGTLRPRQFKLPPQRVSTPDHTERLKLVRTAMNKFFDISCDNDMPLKNPAPEAEIQAYEDEVGPGPAAPYSPDWANLKGPWNHALLVLFMGEYTKQYPIEDQDEQDEVCKMFMGRLERLRRKVKQRAKLPGETNRDADRRLLAKDLHILKEQRRNTRRNERFDTRSKITVQNGMVQRGEAKIIWDHLDDILDKLGAGGMSSDESDVEDGRLVYWVKSMGWRRRSLTARMIWIDRDRNITTAYNSTRPGNPPRTRKRRVNATDTSRNAPPNLPINFYDEEWYKELDEIQKRELNAGPALELLEVDRVY